jgi:hypothetical protein
MEFVLQINERRVGSFSEFDTAQDGAREVRSDLFVYRLLNDNV